MDFMGSNRLRRVTIKLGTSVVSDDSGEIRQNSLRNIVANISEVSKSGIECILVSSGSIGLGKNALNQFGERKGLAFKQACASVGQSLLMDVYSELFKEHGLMVGQILVTADDLSNRKRYLNLRELLLELLAMKIIPIVNENDSVSTAEIESDNEQKVFGDNDKLSALVASKLGSDRLLLLSDIDGIYSENPKINAKAKKIDRIDQLSELDKVATQGKSVGGRGGMGSKLQAIRLASLSGVETVVGRGHEENIISKMLGSVEDLPGTIVMPSRKITGRSHWIRFSSGIEGVLVINQGAQKALETTKASLLPIGVSQIKGEFDKGEIVSVQNEFGDEVARGVANFSANQANQIKGLNSAQIEQQLGLKSGNELIHRNKLAVFKES